MHNLYAIFVKFLDICKQFADDLVDTRRNIPRVGSKPRFSDLEVIALNLTMESLSIDSESFFFTLLQGMDWEIKELKAECFVDGFLLLVYPRSFASLRSAPLDLHLNKKYG